MRLSDIAEVAPYTDMESINHYTVQRVIDVDANVDGRDLGGVAADLSKVIAKMKPSLPATTNITIRGQNEVMNTAFTDLGEGLILAVILVYALLVVLFQSWVDPLIIMMAVPGALMGILWMLALTGTTINVESLMGAIMSVGISVSNSILVVSFANDIRVRENLSALEAVIEAGRTRLRPILMTAMAMILGMIPMALGLGEAGEQNAPLGRAVIGGLLVATVSHPVSGAHRLYSVAPEAAVALRPRQAFRGRDARGHSACFREFDGHDAIWQRRVSPRGDPGSGRRGHSGGSGRGAAPSEFVVRRAPNWRTPPPRARSCRWSRPMPRRVCRPSRCWPASRPTARRRSTPRSAAILPRCWSTRATM